MHFKYLFVFPLIALAVAAPIPADTLAVADGANEAVATQSDPTLSATNTSPPPNPLPLADAEPVQAVVPVAATGGDDSIPSRSDKRRA
ncbi:hypothetical protein HKX48_008441 [Thoreauomyces humboldtii]|nr:hypothetical protein HKX48_008441 [Thoreauomyces humboldtii]